MNSRNTSPAAPIAAATAGIATKTLPYFGTELEKIKCGEF